MHGRTRQRNSLRPTVKESRYFEEKQSGSYFKQQRSTPSITSAKKLSDLNRTKVDLSHALIPFETDDLVGRPMSRRDMQENRRGAIHYLFECIYGNPPEDRWKEEAVVNGNLKKKKKNCVVSACMKMWCVFV